MISLTFVLILAYLGCALPILHFFKQAIFQGRDLSVLMLLDPRTYLNNPIFAVQLFVILAIALFGWILEGYLRQYLKLSQMYAWSTLVTIPLSVFVTLLTLYFSERSLAEAVNWNAAVIWVVGYSIAAYGASILVK